jgi:choline transport protein
VTLLYWAIILICVFVNVAAGWLLPKFEGALLVLHILGFFAILIPLLVLGPKGDAHEIFTTFVNMGGWDSQGLSFCIGIMGSVFAFVGGDGPIHVNAIFHVPVTGLLTASRWRKRSKTRLLLFLDPS